MWNSLNNDVKMEKRACDDRCCMCVWMYFGMVNCMGGSSVCLRVRCFLPLFAPSPVLPTRRNVDFLSE
ncbi:unnamed protein product [Acanthoscelides obtectus]|uniref:Uncharacterized protein n=1 Tax=Acanthoscelides obtectus TaxID=200917 RepID=A0A9P0M4L0_ACAOB|nr:unnamed protein product [Acanthoscelides obtectus]CAK1651439.1 hypothetical protein AOBTE_LOCUS17274 [Acanthoscelides obtectus]